MEANGCRTIMADLLLEGLKENLMGEYLKNILVEIKKVLEEAMKRPDGRLAKEVVLGRLEKNAESGIKHV